MTRPQYGIVVKLNNKSLQGNFICNDSLFKPSQLIEIADPMAWSIAPPKYIHEVILTHPFSSWLATSDVQAADNNGLPVLRERVQSWHRIILSKKNNIKGHSSALVTQSF